MTRIKNIEVEFLPGSTIDDNMSEMKQMALEYDAVITCSFNGKMLNSTMSIDEAYELVTGRSEKEFEDDMERYKGEIKKAEEKHRAEIPFKTEQMRLEARGIIREEKLSKWDEIVPIRLDDLYHGMELGFTLTLVKMLDIDNGSLKEAEKEFYRQGHSGTSAHLMFAMMNEFCIRGQEFVEHLKN